MGKGGWDKEMLRQIKAAQRKQTRLAWQMGVQMSSVGPLIYKKVPAPSRRERIRKAFDDALALSDEQRRRMNPFLVRPPDGWSEPLTGWRLWTVADETGGPHYRAFSGPFLPAPAGFGKRPVELRGWAMKHWAWKAQEATSAECPRLVHFPHTPPHFDCVCGLYSFKSEEQCLDALRGDYAQHLMEGAQTARQWLYAAGTPITIGLVMEVMEKSRHVPVVFGQVRLWGRVVVHRDGYRAQHSYPYELTVVSGAPRPDIATKLRNVYQVDVREVLADEIGLSADEMEAQLRRRASYYGSYL